MSSDVYSAAEAPADTAEDIAEMMAEAARVDALFQSGAISTMWLLACDPLPAVTEKNGQIIRSPRHFSRVL
jgi:hypothetical protein